MSHVFAIYVVFKKLSERSNKKKHFAFKTLQFLTLQFQFWKILEGHKDFPRISGEIEVN